jgi:copper(I)-binding protein
MRITTRAALAATAVALASMALAGCSSAGGGGITVSDAWARTSMAMAEAGAAYMVIENSGTVADAITGGSSPVAEAVEVHETVDMSSAMPAEGGGMDGGMASASPDPMAGGGVMGMQKVDRLEIPAGGSVELRPGSYHIMLIGLKQELKAGETIELTLDFEQAGPVVVEAEVRAN